MKTTTHVFHAERSINMAEASESGCQVGLGLYPFVVTCELLLGIGSCLGSVMQGTLPQILADRCRGVDSPH